MNARITRRVAPVLVAVGALGLVPVAGAGQNARPQGVCPERTGKPCTGALPDRDRLQAQILPQPALGTNGEQLFVPGCGEVWKAGDWLMC
jgi:hypothetical protein